ncbi:MAG TPA: hypothetical protein VMG58_00025 [Candidatus Sulfotelmatobacter sp.]|nr:hypothetical protein [Candidatus Sulfotelmatobacter sp.]
MRITLTAVFVASLLWLCLAFVLDRYAVAPALPWMSHVATIKLQFKWPLGSVNLPRIGLVTLLGVPLLVLAAMCVPRRHIGEGAAWLSGFQTWARTIVWFVALIVLILAGQMLYIVLQKMIPEGVSKLAESFEVHGAISIFDFDFAELTGSLSALLGLIVGLYLFLKKGVRDTLNSLLSQRETDK